MTTREVSRPATHRFTEKGARRRAALARRLALGGAVAALLLPAAELAAQELRYSLTPFGQRIQWDDALGLTNTWMYGGRVGFVFGQWVELQGFYARSGNDVDTRFGSAGLPAPGGGELAEGRVEVDNYGADVLVNLGPWRLRPFLRAGGSVLRLQPEGGARTSQIALRAGGGVRFGNPGQLRLQLYVEDLAFRLNRYRLTTDGDGTLAADPDAEEVRHNLVYGAGVTIPLGGAAGADDTPSFGVGGLSLPIELFGGVLDFDGEDGLDRQNLIGVRTGLDFGRYVGLRGFYWRGVNDDFDDTRPIQGWGGEAQFNLNAGPGFAPFLVAGAGKLDFRSGFENDAGDVLRDRTVLILGGGMSLRLTDRLRLNASARNYLSNPDDALEDVSRTDDLRGTWLFSAGLGFNIGGGTSAGPTPRGPRLAAVTDTLRAVDTVFVDARTGERVAAPGRTRIAAAGRVAGQDTVRTDTVLVDRATGERVRAGEVELPARERAREGFVSTQTTTIPVPSEGEIYVRYGPARDGAPGVSPLVPLQPGAAPGVAGRAMPQTQLELRESIRTVIREEFARQGLVTDAAVAPSVIGAPPAPQRAPVVAPQPAPQPAPAPGVVPGAEQRAVPTIKERPIDAAAMEARIMARVDELMALQAQRDAQRAVTAPAATDAETMRQLEERAAERDRLLLQEIERVVADQVRREVERLRLDERQVVPVAPVVSQPAPARTTTTIRLEALSAYGGATVGDGAQLLLGARLNLGSFLAAMPNLALVPELAFGFGGGGTSTLVAANAQYWFGRLGTVRPYVGAGVGVLDFSDEVAGNDGLSFVVNPAAGAAWTLGGGSPLGATQLFAEYQGVDLFEIHRLNAGLRWDWGR